MRSSLYEGMEYSEIQVANFLTELDLWWHYESPVFVYDKKKRPRVWTPDFYIPKLGMYVEVCGSQDWAAKYQFREEVFKENGYRVIFVHFYKEKEKWKSFLVKRIREIEESRHLEVTKMLNSIRF
jgi:hypothetical protein